MPAPKGNQYAKGHSHGRPSDYTSKFIEEVDKYIQSCNDEDYRLIKTDGEKSTTWENKVRVKLPTIEGFAKHIGVATSSLYLWAKDHPDFSEALDKIKREQKQRLIENGLAGKYNPVIAKLVLSANHGMAEKNEVSGPNGQPLFNPSPEDVQEFLNEFDRKFTKQNVKKSKPKA